MFDTLKWFLGISSDSFLQPVTVEAYKALKDKPCPHHSLAVRNLATAEVKRIRKFMVKCEVCGWYRKVEDKK